MPLDLEPSEAEGASGIVALVPAIRTGNLPLLDGGWLAALDRIEERVLSLKIVDGASAQTASDLQRRVTTAGQDLKKARAAAKEPHLAATRAIDAALAAPEERIEKAKAALGQAQVGWIEAERLRVRREQEAREAEIRRLREQAEREERERRLAAEKAAREAEAARIAKEQADAAEAEEQRKRLAAGESVPLTLEEPEDEQLPPLPPALVGLVAKDGLLWRDGRMLPVGEADSVAFAAGLMSAERAVALIEDHQRYGFEEPPPPAPKSQAQVALEAALHAPTPVAAKPQGVAMRATLKIASVDVAKLPEPFITKTANMAGIRATFCNGWKDGDALPVCPGVTFEVERSAASTRQRI